ncbi:MAG TPA: alpha/beta hydrolase [Chitinophagales bacterium]|nr:alpha/beta hydrolase [Chitinophagales bacterium]
MNKLFLLPGFGEDTFCFNELTALINNHEFIHVDYRLVLDKFTFPFITVKQFATQLIKFYNIQPNDKIIGHSMGGYFAFQIRELQGNAICMIGSFNDPKKVLHMVPQFPRITLFAAFTGLVKNQYLKNYLLKKIKNENYRKIQSYIMDNFDSFSDKQLALIIEMTYENKILSTLPNPLRIHDKADRIVAAPDEEFIQVNGGHFCLNLFPNETFEAMTDFLKID